MIQTEGEYHEKILGSIEEAKKCAQYAVCVIVSQ